MLDPGQQAILDRVDAIVRRHLGDVVTDDVLEALAVELVPVFGELLTVEASMVLGLIADA